MADHAMCSFLTRTFLLVRDADKCPTHCPEFFVVVTVIAARRARRVDHILGRNQVRPVVDIKISRVTPSLTT